MKSLIKSRRLSKMDEAFVELLSMIMNNIEYVTYVLARDETIICPKCSSDILYEDLDGFTCVKCGYIIYLW